MATLTLTNEALEKYFDMLKGLDDISKKKLILKLTESFETKKEVIDLNALFGKWEDNKDSDQILKEIKESRIEKTDRIHFE